MFNEYSVQKSKHNQPIDFFSRGCMHITMLGQHLQCYKRDWMNLICIVLMFPCTNWHEAYFDLPINCVGSNAHTIFSHTINYPKFKWIAFIPMPEGNWIPAYVTRRSTLIISCTTSMLAETIAVDSRPSLHSLLRVVYPNLNSLNQSSIVLFDGSFRIIAVAYRNIQVLQHICVIHLTNLKHTEKKELIGRKKIICLKGFFWYKQKIYLN